LGDKNTRCIFAVRSKKLQVLRNLIAVSQGKKLTKKWQKVFDDLIKALTFALRLKKWVAEKPEDL